MDNQEFQKLVLKRFDSVDQRFDSVDSNLNRLREDFEEFRSESSVEHENTRKLFGQSFAHLSQTLSLEARVREVERKTSIWRLSKA